MFLAMLEDHEAIALSKSKPYCRKILKTGTCIYGEKCKFQHVTSLEKANAPFSKASSISQSRCAFRRARVHSEDVCRKKQAALTKTNPVITLAAETKEEPDIFSPSDPFEPDPNAVLALHVNHESAINNGD